MLLIDNNEDRSIQPLSQEGEGSSPAMSSKSFINYDSDMKDAQLQSAKVHMNTLSAHDSFGEGSFFITDVKKMTSKKDFLDMPLKDRKCNIELFEDCRTRKLLEECNCVPWELPTFEVRTLKKKESMLKFVTELVKV